MADTSTVVGQTMLIKGNLEGDEDLTVQGRIEGSLNLTKTLIIEPNGVVKADVSVANAVVSGVMVGNLTASDSLEITETGRMVGDIRAPRVIIVEGASVRGKVDMGDLEMPRPASGRKAAYTPKPSSRPVAASKPSSKQPAPAKKPAAPPPPPPKAKKAIPPKAAALKPVVKKKVVVKKKRR
jgi:cytoskeletal protein CcmA (bactofilin family)